MLVKIDFKRKDNAVINYVDLHLPESELYKIVGNLSVKEIYNYLYDKHLLHEILSYIEPELLLDALDEKGYNLEF